MPKRKRTFDKTRVNSKSRLYSDDHGRGLFSQTNESPSRKVKDPPRQSSSDAKPRSKAYFKYELIKVCIAWLTLHPTTQGIFRVPGDAKKRLNFIEEYCKDGHASLPTDDILVADILKMLIRERNVTLFSSQQYREMKIKMAQRPVPIQYWTSVKSTLSKNDVKILNLLFLNMFPAITEKSDLNGMTSMNLNLCISPSLFPGAEIGSSSVIFGGLYELGKEF